MANISGTHDCYGCGVCAIACGKHIIKIQLNDDGFYEPVISEPDKCTNCGLCIDVCAYNHDDLSLKNTPFTSYAAWSMDPVVRRKCSSGGVGFEVGKAIIAQGGKVCGVRFNAEKNQAEHYVATNDQELIPSIGSKYIQSYTVDGFQNIITQLREAKRKDDNPLYLLTGTPCQIDSFRRYLQRFRLEDNFILLDFFCHGVPSKLMWNKYVDYLEKKVGKLTYVSWRNKCVGCHEHLIDVGGEQEVELVDWHDSYNLFIIGENGFLNSRLSHGDIFYRLFFSDSCLCKACYDKCKYKFDHSSADIRIGDAWGKHAERDAKGTNVLIAFTNSGEKLLSKCNCRLENVPLVIIAEGQMKACVNVIKHSSFLFFLLKIRLLDILCILKLNQFFVKLKRRINRIRN